MEGSLEIFFQARLYIPMGMALSRKPLRLNSQTGGVIFVKSDHSRVILGGLCGLILFSEAFQFRIENMLKNAQHLVVQK